MSKLEALRQQPKSVKNQYAFAGAVIVTTVIALLWAVALPSVLSSRAPETIADAEEQTGLTSEFFAEIGDGVANILSAFQGSSTAQDSAPEADIASTTSTPTAPTFTAGVAASTSVEEVLAPAPAPKRILIATTSANSLESE